MISVGIIGEAKEIIVAFEIAVQLACDEVSLIGSLGVSEGSRVWCRVQTIPGWIGKLQETTWSARSSFEHSEKERTDAEHG